MSTGRHIVVALSAAALFAGAAGASPKNELSVAAGLDSAYDDNVYNSRGPDFVNRITPHASYHLIDPRVEMTSAYDFSYWTYALGKAHDSLNHRAELAVEGHPTRRLTLRVGDEFARAEDPGFLSRMGVVAPQIGIFDNIADALIGVTVVRRVFLGLGYTMHFARFDQFNADQARAAIALYDGAEHDVQGSTVFKATRRLDLRFAGRAQVFTAGPQDTDFNRWLVGASYSPSAGIGYHLLRDLEATVDAGPLFYQALRDAGNIPAAPQSGATWRAGANLRYSTRSWRASVGYLHDLIGATGAGTALWADAVFAQVGYHYLEKFDAYASVNYFRNGRAVDQAWAYDGVIGNVFLDWRVVDYFRLGAYYTVRWQETGPGAIPPGAAAAQFPDITRNIVGIRLLAVIGADARPPRREAHP